MAAEVAAAGHVTRAPATSPTDEQLAQELEELEAILPLLEPLEIQQQSILSQVGLLQLQTVLMAELQRKYSSTESKSAEEDTSHFTVEATQEGHLARNTVFDEGEG